jgi:hypothetical protein
MTDVVFSCLRFVPSFENQEAEIGTVSQAHRLAHVLVLLNFGDGMS